MRCTEQGQDSNSKASGRPLPSPGQPNSGGNFHLVVLLVLDAMVKKAIDFPVATMLGVAIHSRKVIRDIYYLTIHHAGRNAENWADSMTGIIVSPEKDQAGYIKGKRFPSKCMLHKDNLVARKTLVASLIPLEVSRGR